MPNACHAAYSSRPAHPAVGASFGKTDPALNFLYLQISDLNGETDLRRGVAEAPAPTTDEVRALALPTMFIIGEEDVVIAPAIMEATARCVSGARVERVSGAGHSVYFEEPGVLNALVADFLAS